MGVSVRKKANVSEVSLAGSAGSHAANYARAGARATLGRHTGKWRERLFSLSLIWSRVIERQGRVDEMTAPGKCFCSHSLLTTVLHERARNKACTRLSMCMEM